MQSPPHKTLKSLSTDILFFNILPRLPGKSISRFKCVSKQWNSFLNTPLFTNIHLDHQQNNHKLLLFSTTKPSTFHTIDCEPLANGLTIGRPLPFYAESSNRIRILASCNGLVCVGITTSGDPDYAYSVYSYMILWNPLTGECKTMSSKSDSENKGYKVVGSAWEMYYKASDDDYKVLSLTDNGDAFVYSLKADSWTQLLYSMDALKQGHKRVWGASIRHHGKLYFIDKEVRMIIRFDTNTEKFTAMEAPCVGDEKTLCLNSMLLHKEGELHMCVIYKYNPNSAELGGKLWRLDGGGDWKEVVNYQIPSKFYSLKPLYMKKNGNWLTVCRNGCDVNELDPGREFKKSSFVKSAHKLETRRKGIYIESFVSPNRNRKVK